MAINPAENNIFRGGGGRTQEGAGRGWFPTAPLSANYKVKPMFAAGVVADDEPTRRAAVRSAKERELAGRGERRRGRDIASWACEQIFGHFLSGFQS